MASLANGCEAKDCDLSDCPAHCVSLQCQNALVENAHPKLKEIARFGAPSNVDAGVFQVLEKLLA